MNKKILTNIIVIILLIVSIVFVLNLARKNEAPVSNETLMITTTPIPTSILNTENNFLSVSWLINSLDLPKQIKVVKKEDGQISDDLIEKIAQYFGFGDPPAVKDSNFIMYKAKDLKSSMDINKETNVIKYNKNLLLFPIEKNETIINTEEIKNKLSELIKSVFGLNQINLRFDEINYQEIYGPRYISSNESQATIIEIRAVYMVNNYPIYSQNGYPVMAKFTRDGTLVNLIVNWPGKFSTTEITKNIKSFDEIKNTKGSEFKIISVDGDKYFDMSSEDEVIKKTEITGGYFGFLNLPQNSELKPSVFLNGNSSLKAGPVSVILSLSVSK